MRPLRPATDHRLGGPLPHQLANRPQPPPPAALAGLCSSRLAPQRGHAVLARVSPGYPPLEGRLATCYSPVRHFTGPDVLLHPNFLVRLACVRHAASVDSEPGSNSRLNSARVQARYRRAEAQTRRPEGRLRAACTPIVWSSPAREARRLSRSLQSR